jgi:hypothetical protein
MRILPLQELDMSQLRLGIHRAHPAYYPYATRIEHIDIAEVDVQS